LESLEDIDCLKDLDVDGRIHIEIQLKELTQLAYDSEQWRTLLITVIKTGAQ
jgi:hypothetical protein